MSASQRCNERRSRVEGELDVDLSLLGTPEEKLGHSDEKNCEQMIGTVPLPVGIAGPLTVHFSSGEKHDIHLPLATTEGALVASVNRGCKALSMSGGVYVRSVHHGMTRSLAFKCRMKNVECRMWTEECAKDWIAIAENTSKHLKVLRYDVDEAEDYLFLTLACDTDEAMGMNMVTIAAQAVGEWLSKAMGLEFITVAGNVDSDKKPSQRTHDLGRGFEVIAEAVIPETVIEAVLKSSPVALLKTAHAKLEMGSAIAGAIGKNLHAANIIAALYLATGQDAAHVVEGSLTDTSVAKDPAGIRIAAHSPALLVGILGGGTALPTQKQCLDLLLKRETSLARKQQLAESIGGAVLAGELSLLAAQASHHLANAHKKFRETRIS